jgi:hypothetical protein
VLGVIAGSRVDVVQIVESIAADSNQNDGELIRLLRNMSRLEDRTVYFRAGSLQSNWYGRLQWL